jgi:hypothetical protein
MLHRTVKRLTTGAAVALTALVATGGAAAADAVFRPDDRATHGPGAIAQTNDWVTSREAGRPDDHAVHGPGAIVAAQRDVVLRPDDRADRRLPTDAPVAQPTTGEGFDWVDAGIGSAATFGLVLLVAGASVMRLRQQAQTA